jgi:hypothetical protein
MKAAILLACLALPALVAQAQTHAPAEDRPGRIVLVPMSVERPAGSGWVLLRRSDTDLSFLHPAERDRNSMVAVVSSRVPDKRIRTIDDLMALVRKELQEKVDPKRLEILAEDIRPDPVPDRKCARYRQQARDLAAAADGKAQVIDLHGQVCLHPLDEGILLAATLSERAPAGLAARNLGVLAERFFGGVRPHAPLRGGEWRPLAEEGDANAQVWLARALVQANKAEEAVAWLRRGADKGHADAQSLLGLSLFSGRGAARNPAEAVKWLRMAAERNYPKAEGLLALVLLTAAEVRNEDEGRRWANKAAADGDPLGQALVGELLVFGRAGAEKKEAEGAAWMRKSAEQGDARAQYTLASLLANGVGVEKDLLQSRFWLELAAAQGHAEARKILDQAKQPAGPAPAAAGSK